MFTGECAVLFADDTGDDVFLCGGDTVRYTNFGGDFELFDATAPFTRAGLACVRAGFAGDDFSAVGVPL